MTARIGVYVCHCGTNIADKIRVNEIVQYASDLPKVVLSRDYRFMCSEPGQEQIYLDIQGYRLNRVVVAACSPRMHEGTFRKTCEKAGINPYFLQVANIREQVSWTVEEEGAATEKAKALVRAAVARVTLHQPLPTHEVEVHRDVLVVGGGIAGIQAALEIADGGYQVHLVERLQSIGGHMAQLDKTFPTLDCSSCILTPKMVAAGIHPQIKLHTYSEVEAVSGYVGNFRVTIRHKASYVNHDKCTGCGLCQEKCPKQIPSEYDEGMGRRKAIYTLFPQAVPNKPVIDKNHCIHFQKGKCRSCETFCEMEAIDFQEEDCMEEVEVGSIIVASGYDLMDPQTIRQYGYGRYPDVITGLQFERLASSAGPTGGKILLKDGREPRDVAILHCVGSRDKNYHEYCSRVCCMYALKFAHLIREKTSTNVFLFYIDMRCYGKGYEEFYERVQTEGAVFVRGKAAMVTDQAVYPEEKGRLVVLAEDTISGESLRVSVDMVVLATAMEARADADEVGRRFHLSRGRDGFFLEQHPKLAPVSTAAAGIFLAGTCQGPKDIPDTVAHASAAAAKSLSLVSRGRVEVEAMSSEIDPELCAGCQACLTLCPYSAVTYHERRGVSMVTEALCQGCGACAAACPSGAARLKHFTSDQVLAEIDGLMGA